MTAVLTDYDPTPPQDIPAEQAALGGMLLSKDALAEVAEILTTGDFYKPAHSTIFDAILDLYGRGEPADPITVVAYLTDQGTISRVGGAEYIHTIIQVVPTVGNATYYAHVVAERATLRRVMEAGTRILQVGGSAIGAHRDTGQVVDEVQQIAYALTTRRGDDGLGVLADLLQPALDEIEAGGAHDGIMRGIPTGFADLDRVLCGLHGGQLVIVAGRPGLGKALALDTPIPTPHGWRQMGDLQAGDKVLDVFGDPTHIAHAWPTLTGRTCYRVTFDDGTHIVADADHQWPVRLLGHHTHPPHIRTTHDLYIQYQTALTQMTAGVVPNARRLTYHISTRAGTRGIRRIIPVPSVPVRCISVDAYDRLYLAGRGAVPTHNSTVAMDFLRHATIGHHLPGAMFSLEMSKVEVVMRVLAAETRVPLQHLRSGRLSDSDWTKLARRMGEISEAPLFVDDTPNLTLMEVRAKARRLKERHDLKLVVVDYLQLMTAPSKRAENRQQEVADMSRGLKLLAKEIDVPVVAVSQLNRGPEQRADKRPMLSDMRESGAIEMDADVVVLLHREDYYDKESPRAGEADFIVAKHRNGPTDTVTVAAQLHLARFVDMAMPD